MKEKLYSLIGLGFLTVGFIMGVAGADNDGPKDLAHATDQLIRHVSIAKEANDINQTHTIIAPSNDEEQARSTVVVVSPDKDKKKLKN